MRTWLHRSMRSLTPLPWTSLARRAPSIVNQTSYGKLGKQLEDLATQKSQIVRAKARLRLSGDQQGHVKGLWYPHGPSGGA